MYPSTRSRIALLLALALLLASIVAPVSAQENSISIGINAPQDLDPHIATTDSAILLNRSIYDYLIEITPTGELAPNLAASWDVSDDGLTYTIHLAEGVTFHDGSTFTAADVVYSFNRIKALAAPPTALLGTDYEVSASDESTVVFTVPEPLADFLVGLASNQAFIIQDGAENPNQLGEGETMFANFNGTGPFLISDFRPEESLTLVKNENYWVEGQPLLDQLQIVYFPDKDAEINAVLDGAVDVIFRLPLDQLFRFDGAANITIDNIDTLIHPAVRIRADEGHLGEDVRIRQAFKRATNRQEINDLLLDGLGLIGNNDPIGPLYPEVYPGDLPDAYDPDQACALIMDATGEPRLSVTLYAVQSFNYPQLAEILEQQWQAGCIDAEIIERPESIYYSGETNEWLEVDLGITGWGHRIVPQEYLNLAYVTGGPFNETHWSNSQLDELAAQAAVTVNTEERAAIYAQIAEIFAEEGPVIIPFFLPLYSAVNTSVSGLEVNPFAGRTDFRNVNMQ